MHTGFVFIDCGQFLGGEEYHEVLISVEEMTNGHLMEFIPELRFRVVVSSNAPIEVSNSQGIPIENAG